MRPKKSVSDWSKEGIYPEVLLKLCKTEDVLIIPKFVTQYLSRQSRISPRKLKDSGGAEKYGGSSIFENDSAKENFFLNETLEPPEVRIIYESPENKEIPIAVICKNIYIEYSLINAIGKSLKSFPTITTLKIENCCISKEIAETLALILSEESGKQITELSLDGNEKIAQVLPLFVSFTTNLRYLSLQKCSLNDKDIQLLAKPLAYSDEKHHKLQVLRLGLNKIADVGVSYLANALRTNRTLISLSLLGNQIGDKGVSYLCEVLMKFKLTHEEVMLKRKRIFDQILKKKHVLQKYLEDWRLKEVQSPTLSVKNSDKPPLSLKKNRRLDGKTRCLTSRDKGNQFNYAKINSEKKLRGKIGNNLKENEKNNEPNPSELLAIEEQIEARIIPDKHPFVNEIFTCDDKIWCYGCWSIRNINFAYNYLTEKSVEKFIMVFNSQSENFRKQEYYKTIGVKTGLRRLILLPGNSILENSNELQKLESAIYMHNSEKEIFEMPNSVPVGSASNAWNTKQPKK